MEIFLSTAMTVILYLLVIGAVVRAYIILPRRLRDMDKRIKELENRKDT